MSNEPVLLTRRFFLLGAAATVAVASLPALLPKEITRLPAGHAHLRRKVYEMTLEFERPADKILRDQLLNDDWFRITVKRIGDDDYLHQVAMNIRSSYRWVAHYNSQWDSTPDNPLTVDVEFSRPWLSQFPAVICMGARDYIDAGPPVHVWETHRIFEGIAPPPIVNFMEPDNSLEARLARESFAKKPLPLAFDDDDYEDDDDDD
jgi:hypothetical protein